MLRTRLSGLTPLSLSLFLAVCCVPKKSDSTNTVEDSKNVHVERKEVTVPCVKEWLSLSVCLAGRGSMECVEWREENTRRGTYNNC